MLEARHAEDSKQDLARAEEDYLERLSELNGLVQKIVDMPAENYDAPLSARINEIEVLDPPPHAEVTIPAWLTSPLRRELADGTAVGNATRLLPVNAPPQRRVPSPVRRSPHRAARPAAGSSSDAPPIALSSDGSASPSPARGLQLDDYGDSDDSEPEPAVAAVAGAKRVRTQRVQYAPPVAAAAKAKVAKVAPAPKPRGKAAVAVANGAAVAAPFGMNSRGKPYARPCGGYNSNLARMVSKAAAAPAPASAAAAKRPAQSASNHATIDTPLNGVTALTELQKLRVENAQLLAKLDVVTAGQSNEVRLGILTTKAEMAEKLLEQFQAGLERGIQMMSGQPVRFTSPPFSGAGM